MDYRTSKGKSEFYIGNGTLWLTDEALAEIAELMDMDADVFLFISDAVNQFVKRDDRLGNIEKMLQELMDGEVKVQEKKKPAQEPSVPVDRPAVKISSSGGGGVDLMKALQSMQKFTR